MTRLSLALSLVCVLAAFASGAEEGAVVLSPAADLEWVTNERGASFSHPWKEDNGRHGDVIRFPAGFDSGPHSRLGRGSKRSEKRQKLTGATTVGRAGSESLWLRCCRFTGPVYHRVERGSVD